MPQLKYHVKNNCAVGTFNDGRQILIDIADLRAVCSKKWFVDSVGYPTTTVNGKNTRLHIFLLGKQPQSKVIDHINRNKLDNRRCNLRVCTQKENIQNASLKSTNKSGIAGVYFVPKTNKWRAQISLNSKTKHIGIFSSFEEATQARKKAEQIYYKGCDYHL